MVEVLRKISMLLTIIFSLCIRQNLPLPNPNILVKIAKNNETKVINKKYPIGNFVLVRPKY